MYDNNFSGETRDEILKHLGLGRGICDKHFESIAVIVKELINVPYAGLAFFGSRNVIFDPFIGQPLATVDINDYLRTLSNNGIILINDTANDNRSKDLKIVMDKNIGIASYASIPLFWNQKYLLGEIFVADRKKRQFKEFELSKLKYFSRLVEYLINLKAGQFAEKIEMQKELDRINKRCQTLEEEKARSLTMLEDIGDVLIGTNDNGDIVFINNAASVMMGYKADTVIGQPFIKTFRMYTKDAQEVDVIRHPLRNALFFNKKIKNTDYFFKSRNGNLFPIAVTASPVVFYGRVIGGIVLVRDITKEKEVDRMKTEFISLASHQLRTPLSSTKWFAELIIEDSKNLNQEQLQIVKNIHESNERMIGLVNGLLNISRIESGRIMIEPKMTNMRELVDAVILELTPKIQQKKLRLGVNISKDLPLINIDPKLIRNVYLNLISNSVKYSIDEGAIEIKVYIKDKFSVSEVTDWGLGIPKDQQERIFEKFFRADNITRVVTDGSGLGLYLAKLIVQASGGNIGFNSEEFKGTTFWFTLPVEGVLPKRGEVSIES